jgi:small subunit ribosomal protein S20
LTDKTKGDFLPHHKSCKKRLKTSATERVRNQAVKTMFRAALKNARGKIAGGEAFDLGAVCADIDKAYSKGIIHRNKAARLKSRLAKAAARISAGES